jgi:Ca-activated chloride channel homolog
MRLERQLSTMLLVTVLSNISTNAQEPQHSLTENPSITVFLTVSGKHGSPATAIQPQLNVFVDKQPARVNNLRSGKDDPLLFVVLVDISKSEASNSEAIKGVVLQLFRRLATDRNRGYLAVFNDSIAISKTPTQVLQMQMALNSIKFGGGTAVYDAIERICSEVLSRSRNPDIQRRAILLISDGEDNSSHIPHEKAETTAEKEGVPVFSLATHSSLAGPRGEHFLKEVSHNTGGREIKTENLAESLPLLLTAIDEQWALSFAPPQSADKKLHSLNIKILQKDVEISAPAHIFLQ